MGGIAPPAWSRYSAIAFIDDAGFGLAITSISTLAYMHLHHSNTFARPPDVRYVG